MVIQYYGLGLVKVTVGDLVLAFNPVSKEAAFKAPRFGADIGLSCLADPLYAGSESITSPTKIPFIIDGPGEYEISGLFIVGLPSRGPNDKINTIFTVTLDGVRLCHLGAILDADLPLETKEALGTADIVFAPVGFLLETDGDRLVTSLEPKIIIPTGWQTNTDPALKSWLKESGASGAPVDKLTLRRKDLEGKEGEPVYLQSF